MELTIPYSDFAWCEGKVKGHTTATSVYGSGCGKPNLNILSLKVMMLLAWSVQKE